MTRWRGRVVLVLATSTGGIGAHVADLARGLAADGAQVTVCGPAATNERFTFDAPLPGDQEVTADRTPITFVPVEVSAQAHPSDARAVLALRRVLTQQRPDVIHAHGLRAGLVSAWAVRARDARSPLVVTLHNTVLARGVRGGASRVAERLVVRTADVILGASADLVAHAEAAGACDARLAPVATPARFAPQRSPESVRTELGVPPGTPLLLSVGRLHPQKGYDVLVQAAARWRDRTPVPAVVIAGNGPSYLDLTARISAARAPVTLLGHRDDVADLLAAADLALVTSVWEARQLFAQEALQAGVPLVATAVGGIPDLVGDAAILVPAGDVDAFDAAVQQLLDDPDAQARYARAGRAQAATWPTTAQMLSQVRQVYAQLSADATQRQDRR